MPAIVAAVLVARGTTDPAEAERFLNPSLSHFHDPRLLPDYEAAVGAILAARERGETVYVHGDYDADGVTSAALLTRFLESIKVSVVPHVPHRVREGYGIHLDAIGWAKEKGASLFLTCDCGVSAHDQVKAAQEAGMTVVVTDHHQVPDTLPGATAVVNPHRNDSRYPFAELCGVGVAFKLCAGLTAELVYPVDRFYRAFLDLAVIGTVADVMPLIDENRVIAKFGLPELERTQKQGLRAIIDTANLGGRSLSSRDIGFGIGPRINAVGRLDDSGIALDAMLTRDPVRARELARQLETVNDLRREEQARSVDAAIEQVQARGLSERLTMLVADPDWHPGVIGLVAGRLTERFRRPTFVVTVQGGVAKGSARSLPGFDLGRALRALSSWTLSGGGHELAAGFSIEESKVAGFAEALEAYAERHVTAEVFRPRLALDAEVTAQEAGPAAIEALRCLEPYGTANPEPLFAVRGVRLKMVAPTSKPEHVRVTFDTEAGTRTGMAFGIGERVNRMEPGAQVDVAFRIEENVWNGRRDFRWTVVDVQSSSD